MLSARLLNFSFCYMYRLRENSDTCLQRYSCAPFLQENGRPNARRNMKSKEPFLYLYPQYFMTIVWYSRSPLSF